MPKALHACAVYGGEPDPCSCEGAILAKHPWEDDCPKPACAWASLEYLQWVVDAPTPPPLVYLTTPAGTLAPALGGSDLSFSGFNGARASLGGWG
jgi:hypothetical protein